MTSWWRPEVHPDLSQGDLLEDVTFSQREAPPESLTKGTGKGGVTIWEQQGSWTPNANGLSHLLAKGRRGMALVLSHSCELDKQKGHKFRGNVLVCVVQPLANVDAAYRQTILDQGKISAMPLPEAPPDAADLYADLRTTVMMSREQANRLVRRATLSKDGVERLQLQLIAYFTRVKAGGVNFAERVEDDAD